MSSPGSWQSAFTSQLSFPSNSATTYKWLARTGPSSASIPGAGGWFRSTNRPRPCAVFLCSAGLNFQPSLGRARQRGACNPGPRLSRAGSPTHAARPAAESPPGPRPSPPTPHPGGQRRPGRSWLKTEAHQVMDCRRQEPGARWLALFALSHFFGGVPCSSPAPLARSPASAAGLRERGGVMGGENVWGCGRETHHQTAPPRARAPPHPHPPVCFVHASPPKQRSGSWKSWKQPVMALTRSGPYS
jgi:hypothetical protein